ncbi:cytoskeletal protein binding protein [Mortierella sp. NVP85]|nr:cytoskeletal protein binding protein [Mortierella sp. NVP85]
MPFLNVLVALYAYEANTEDELSIKGNDVLYILEHHHPHWCKAKLKTADPSHSLVGLIPSNYVEPLPSIGTVRGLYKYEAATEEELTIEEGDTLTLYERDDPDWFLVGNGSQVGFVPRNYVEVSSGGKVHPQDHQALDERKEEHAEDPADEDQREELTQPRSNSPTVKAHGDMDSIKIWPVEEIDKKNKKKGRLGIGNGIVVFGSEVDKSPVRYWLIKDVINVTHEKSHVYLDIGGTSPSSLNFKAASKQEAVAIFYKIQRSYITHHVMSPASTSLIHHSMSVPTYPTREPRNTSAPCTRHHEPRSDVPAASFSTLAPVPTLALHATRPVRVTNMNKPKNMRKRMTRSGRGGGRGGGRALQVS